MKRTAVFVLKRYPTTKQYILHNQSPYGKVGSKRKQAQVEGLLSFGNDFLFIDLSYKLQMADVQVVRGEVLDKYRQLCGKINHTPNASFVRTFGNATVKSFYLDLVFRGNEKLHFGNRFTDRDIILLSSALEGH